MPIPASELENEPYLRLLVVGEAKVGKSSHVVSTSPRPVRVLLGESDSALKGAKRETSEFDFERVVPRANGDILDLAIKYIVQAKDEARKGNLKTVVLDPLSAIARNLLEENMRKAVSSKGNEIGMAAHGQFNRDFVHIVNLFLSIPAHTILVCNFGSPDDKEESSGILPFLPNKNARRWIRERIYDIVRFDYAKEGDSAYQGRVFITGLKDSWGPGCRSRRGADIIPAHIGSFIEWANEADKTKPEEASTVPPFRTVGGKRQ